MALGDLFKSKKEREREQAKKRRKAFRDAERAVDALKDRVAKLKRERDKAWAEARQYLKDGQKPGAQRCLQTCRASELLIAKLDRKRWVAERKVTELEAATGDQDLASALGDISAILNIDPETVVQALDDVEESLGEQADIDKVWEKVYGKEMEGVENQSSDMIPSIADMEKQLNDEVAAELGGQRSLESMGDSEGKPGLHEQIGEGRRRLKDLLEDEK